MDTGTGISAEHLEKVHGALLHDQGGRQGQRARPQHGLRLRQAIERRVPDRQRVGGGTTAELWLPRAPEQLDEQDAGRARTDGEGHPTAEGLAGRRSPEVRNTTAAVLEDSGHEVVEAGNGADALDLLKKRECDFDLLITDYAMPHLSGTDFLREARMLCPDVARLLDYRLCRGRHDPRQPDGVEMLLKPFTPAVLEGAIARICDAEVVLS